MTLIIIGIAALMFYLNAHPVALTIGLTASIVALTLDTRKLLLERKS